MNFNLNYFILSTVAAIFIMGNVAVADADTTQLRGGGGTNEDITRHNSRELDADIDLDMLGGGNPDNELDKSFEGDDAAEGNDIDTDLVLSTTQDTTITDEYMSSPPGICQTTGVWEDIGRFSAGTPIIPGWTYNGLDFKTKRYKYLLVGSCDQKKWDIDKWCGDSLTHITEAWKKCAKYCNSDAKCISYSAHIKGRNDTPYVIYDCYLHDQYECTNGKDIKPLCEKGDDSCGHLESLLTWSGVCRPMSEHGDYYDKSKTTQKPICSSF